MPLDRARHVVAMVLLVLACVIAVAFAWFVPAVVLVLAAIAVDFPNIGRSDRS